MLVDKVKKLLEELKAQVKIKSSTKVDESKESMKKKDIEDDQAVASTEVEIKSVTEVEKTEEKES